MRVLVTGGAGYIGSHTCVELLHAGFEIVVFDDLSNSKAEALTRVKKITGKSLDFVEGDVRHHDSLRAVFRQYDIDAVIHFAGLKAVGESAQIPLHYYDVNVGGSVALAEVMEGLAAIGWYLAHRQPSTALMHQYLMLRLYRHRLVMFMVVQS